MKGCFLICCILFLLWLAAGRDIYAGNKSAPERPNIILLLTDDQGYGAITAHGHPLLTTPHMDRLHRESVRFDNFYVSPSCSPTRAALLTGMHEFRNGVTHTILPREHLNRDATILPQLLKKAGYHTGFIGKWHLGSGEGYSPEYRGFDFSPKLPGNNDEFSSHTFRNGEKREAFREDIYFDVAMSFMEECGDEVFPDMIKYGGDEGELRPVGITGNSSR